MSTLDRFQSYVDAFNRRDFDAVRSRLDPGIVDHHLPPGVPNGSDGVASWLRLLADSLALRLDVQQVVVAGDLVAASGRIRGTHVGDFPGLPATGRSFDVAITTLERFAGGLIVERWETYDHAALLRQLGDEAA